MLLIFRKHLWAFNKANLNHFECRAFLDLKFYQMFLINVLFIVFVVVVALQICSALEEGQTYWNWLGVAGILWDVGQKLSTSF